jgi:beta-mannosidase
VKTELDLAWTLAAGAGGVPQEVAGTTVPATVPGCVHTDLLAAGLISDPYLDRNEAGLAWIGRTTWRYTASLDVEPARDGERIDLVFDGLDTVCTVRLNDTVLGSPRNMHRAHRFDVTELLVASGNELAVDFEAQLDAAERISAQIGPRPHTNLHPFNAVRKMACNFGWDWGPDLVTAGIWRPVHLHRWHSARLGDVRLLATFEGDTGRLEVHPDVVRATDRPLQLRIRIGDDTVVRELGERLVVDVPGARRWWPRGYGHQPLYDVELALLSGDTVLDEYHRRTGFRTVALDTTPDEHGTPFTILVNDRPILVKGANWIPDDCFPSRVSREQYARSIGDAVDAGMNLLRVWGGGIYESRDFYELCDAHGVLVWQDFLFACAAYAEEPPLRDEVVAEARQNAARLSPHPSLVIWNGNNENLWGHEIWGWKERLGDLTWGRGYYLDVLPRIVAELDPTRPYSPGSPWSFDPEIFPNEPSHGTTHLWDVWNTLDYTHYRDHVPRFVSEFGYQGPPAWATLTRAIHDEPLTPTSPGMLAHQKAADGQDKLDRGIRPHLPVPADFEDWHWAMSVQQARAVMFGIEHFRSWQPVCTGSVVWQLNDCWPVTSWAAVDGDGRRKPLWFALRRAYTDRLLTVQPRDAGLVVAVCNDTDETWPAEVVVRRMTLSGTELGREVVRTTASARATRVVVLNLDLADPRQEFLVADADGVQALWFGAEDKDLALEPSLKATSVDRTTHGYVVRVAAGGLQRDVCLLADKLDPDATVDEGMVTLLPGEQHTFTVRTAAHLDPAELVSHRVLRSVNQLVG